MMEETSSGSSNMLPILPDVLLLCTPLADELIALTRTATSTANLQGPATLSPCWDGQECVQSRAIMSSCASEHLMSWQSTEAWGPGVEAWPR